MFTKKIASLALAALMVIGGTGVTAFAAEPDSSVDTTPVQILNVGTFNMPTVEFAADPDSTQEEKLEVLTQIALQFNLELHAELVSITAEHDQFHQDATASQEANQASRELEVSAIIAASEAGEITKVEAKKALEQMKAETAETIEALGVIKATKTQEDGQLKGSSSALGAELIAEFSSETPDTAVINELLTQLVENQRVHLEIDYKYQAQIDELLGLN